MSFEMQPADDYFIVELTGYSEPWSKVGEVEGSADGSTPAAGTTSLPESNQLPSWEELLEEQERQEKDGETFDPAEAFEDTAFLMERDRRAKSRLIDDAADIRYREIRHGKPQLPGIHRLDQFLEQEDNPQRYAIDDLWPLGGNVLFAAPAKFGKSTVTMNLVRSLLDGSHFLDHFEVDPIKDGEAILLIDLEMSEDRVRSEIRIQNITNTKRLHISPMRGLTAQLDLFNPAIRTLWVDYCKEHNVRTLIIDPLAPLFGYMGVEENDNSAVNRFFNMLDEFKVQAGIRDMLVCHHSGHTADWRPRGASRFNDWPDGLWLAKIEGDITDPTSPRLFYARGRDVGDTFNGPGTIVRDQTTRRLGFTPDANPGQMEVSNSGITENLVARMPGLATGDLHTAMRAAGVTGTDNDLRNLRSDLARDGRLHPHQATQQNPSGGVRPTYWFVDPSACIVCNPVDEQVTVLGED